MNTLVEIAEADTENNLHSIHWFSANTGLITSSSYVDVLLVWVITFFYVRVIKMK